MPGKVNPTQCEAMAQVCIHLQGIYTSNFLQEHKDIFNLMPTKL